MGAVVVGVVSVTTVALAADDEGLLAAGVGWLAPLFAAVDAVLRVRGTGALVDLRRLVVLFVRVVADVLLRVLISASIVAQYATAYCIKVDNAKDRLTVRVLRR
ncbi:MAG TPA: hypothetical protein VJ942_09355 [Roseovarius sp.]|nr:hypothetical protein [Roseovarius sp.]